MLQHLWELRQLLPTYYLLITTLLAFTCFFTLYFPNWWQIIPALTTYGKASDQFEDDSFVAKVSVPKRWFKHFYAIGSVLLILSLHTLYSLTIDTNYLPKWVLKAMKTLSYGSDNPPIPFSTSIWALSLLTLHLLRRLYETIFVSVYSDSKMNIFHYFVGILHYILLPIAILCETAGVASHSESLKFDYSKISIPQIVSSIVFVYFNYQQHQIAHKMASARIGPRGLIRNYAYGIVFGGLFNYVSCPHFLCEIFIYISLWAIIPMAYVYGYVVFFVCVNQIFAALITHQWYLKTFQQYPKNRNALIPFIL